MPLKNPVASENRDARGRFLEGNPGGPGNPNARSIAAIRAALAAANTPAKAVEAMDALHEMCVRDRNATACRLWLDRAAGSSEATDLVLELEDLRAAFEELQDSLNPARSA